MKELKRILSPTSWKKPVSIVWGLKDRWLDFNGVEAFAKSINADLVQLPQVNLLNFLFLVVAHLSDLGCSFCLTRDQ